jgi:hypothetical protein
MENQEKSQLTPDELRKEKGLENLSDQEAEEAIRTIEKFTDLMFKILKEDLLNAQKKSK